VPNIIKNIVCHHAGGLGTNDLASTRHLSPEHISRAHKERWNAPSEIQDERYRYAGYNFIYDPKTRLFVQCRAIGEETMAVKGQNFNSIHLCIIGNYNRAMSGFTIDNLDDDIRQDIVKFLYDLIYGNARGLVLATQEIALDLDPSRVYAHRFFYQTDCYGTGLADTYFRDLLAQYKPMIEETIDTTTEEIRCEPVRTLTERIGILQMLLRMKWGIAFAVRKLGMKREISLGSVWKDQDDNFNLPEDIYQQHADLRRD